MTHLLIYNGFSQKKIKPEYMLRPVDPKKNFLNLTILNSMDFIQI